MSFGSVDDSVLGAQLSRLENETTLEDRFDILKSLVEYWHGKIRPDDGIVRK